MHAPGPQRTSCSGSRCSACVRIGASAGCVGVAGVWLLRLSSRRGPGSARAVARRLGEYARKPSKPRARRAMGEGQPAAAAGAGSPLRAVTECSRLSREEISTMARIAPATAKPAPTRNAWSNPLVRATEALWTPEWKRLWVRLLAIVVRIASPTAPPICWEVLIRPDAGPASCGDRGDRHGHEREPEDGPSTSAANEPPVPGTGRTTAGHRRPAAVRRSASA